jgi:hypothetical protein
MGFGLELGFNRLEEMTMAYRYSHHLTRMK